MSKARSKVGWIWAVVVSLTVVSTVGNACAGEASETLEESTGKLMSILEDPALSGEENREARREKLREIVKARFFLKQMARLTIGNDVWKQATPKQQKRFFELFETLLERNYLDQIEGYAGQAIRFDGERGTKGYPVVETTVVREDAENLTMEYRMLQHKGTWRVYDVSVDGVSLVQNYRDQFSDMLEDGEFAKLLDELEKKIR